MRSRTRPDSLAKNDANLDRMANYNAKIARPITQGMGAIPDELPRVTAECLTPRVASYMQRGGHLHCKVTVLMIEHRIWPLSIAFGQRRPA